MDAGRIIKSLGVFLLVAGAAGFVWWQFFRDTYPLPAAWKERLGLEEPAPVSVPAPAAPVPGADAGRVVMSDATNQWVRTSDGSTRVQPREPVPGGAGLTEAELAEQVPIGQSRLEMKEGRVIIGRVTMEDDAKYWVRMGDGLNVVVDKSKVQRVIKGNGKGP